MKGEPHLLLLEIFHAAYECQIETSSKAVLEEEGGSAAVQLSFGDDGDAVAQQVGLVHVMRGQDHRPACAKVQPLIKCFFNTISGIFQLVSDEQIKIKKSYHNFHVSLPTVY